MAKALWLLIDGYNVVKPSAAPRRDPIGWLHRERRMLLDRLTWHLPERVRQRTCVVFDAKDPPPGVSDRFEHEFIRVRFAVEYPEADDLLEKIIARHSAAKQLTVVSSDNRVKTAASRRGATAWLSDEWLDRLMDGKLELAVDRSKWMPDQGISNSDPTATSSDVDQWLDEFGF